MINRRDVVLAEVFFSDSSESKVRPAIVLSDNTYHENGYLLASAITTAGDDYCIKILRDDLDCQLDKDSSVRFDGIIKLHRKQVIKRIGKVKSGFHASLVGKIIGMLS